MSHSRYPLLQAFLHGNMSQNSGGGMLSDAHLAEFATPAECAKAEEEMDLLVCGFPDKALAAHLLGGATESGFHFTVEAPEGDPEDPKGLGMKPALFEEILNRMY